MLYEQNESYWFRLCLRYAKSRTEAQDIFQEGVVQIFAAIKQFDHNKGNFHGWSNRILIHAALKYIKKHQWQDSFESISSVSHLTIPADFSERLTAKELTALIQQLPIGYRIVFNMFEIEGFSHREIAEILNISVGTSKSQLFKAKKMLQKKLKMIL